MTDKRVTAGQCVQRLGLSCLALATLMLPLLRGGPAAEAAEEAPGSKTSISVPIMKTADIKPGMKGYGLTTFRGVKPERFKVEVVDILRKAFPKHDLILVRCSHPVIEKAHIIAGMSGSPIYIDGKLIGALAYGWSFTKEPIAGVTPIEWMLEEMAEPKGARSAGSGRLRPAGVPPWRSGVRAPDGRAADDGRAALHEGISRASPAAAGASGSAWAAPTGAGPTGLTQLRLPVYLSGMVGLPQAAVGRLRKQFRERGLLLLEGTGGSTYSENIGVEKLVPGAPLGVSLMRGDISRTGIGTLTHREGDRIIAFGHSMLLSGQEVAMPLTTAFIHGVLPSQWSSFKFGSPSKAVGTLTQDRYPAVAGSLGRKCPMIPVTAKVENLTNGKTQTLKVEMIHGRFWSPALLGLTSSYLLLLEGVADTNYVVDYSIDMEFEKHGSLHLEGMETAYWTFGPSAPQRALSRLLNNPFEPMKPKAIDLKFTVIHRRIDARIQRAWFEQLEVQPGKEVRLHIRVNPYEDVPREIIFPIRIPAHLDEGKYDVVVGGGNDWAVQLPTPPAESVKDIFTQLKTRYRPTTAVAVLKLPSVGVGFKGQLYRQLPSSVFGTLVSSSSAGVSTFQDSIHFTHQTSWYLTGATQRLKIIVKQSAEEQK